MVKQGLMLALAWAIAAPVAAPVAAQEKPAGQDNVSVTASSAKKICRTVKETGSRLGGKRDCRTQAEWDYQRQQLGDTMRANALSTPR